MYSKERFHELYMSSKSSSPAFLAENFASNLSLFFNWQRSRSLNRYDVTKKSVWDLLLLFCLVLKFSCERFEHALGHGPCQIDESSKNLTNGVDSIRNGHQRLFACEVFVFL